MANRFSYFYRVGFRPSSVMIIAGESNRLHKRLTKFQFSL